MKKKDSILIVDDDQNMCETLSLYLKDHDYDIGVAYNGQTAISLVEEKKPSIVLLDLKLPDLTGIEVLRKIKPNREELMVIMMSGYASLESSIEAMNEGAYTYLRKPINTEEMMAVIKRAFDKRNLILKNRQLIKDLTALNKLKDEFLAICSHDIKSPLTAIEWECYKINKEENKEMKRKGVDMIRTQSKRIIELVTDLLDISKLESGGFVIKKRKTNINSLIDKVVGDFNFQISQKKIIIDSKQIPSSLMMVTDDLRIEQILKNLLSNAIKFSKRGGKIIFSAKEMLSQKSSYIEFSVQDEGVGIPKDKINCVFDKFIQAHRKDRERGTGLGLAICKKICELHKGKIWVESEEGKGSTVFFTIPMSRHEETKVA